MMNDVYFLGMVDNAAFSGNKSIDTSEIKSDYDAVLIFGVTLNKRENNRLPTRSQLAEIARAFNREFFYTPVVIVYKYGKHLAFANTERLKYKQEWREGEKAGKVSLLRDIDITNPHSGHERILNDLKIPKTGKNKVDSFAKLYDYWQDVFSVNILNKKFYQELSNWYFWAVKETHFPSEPTVADERQKKIDLATLRQEHNAKNVIRLLTRFLFVWFVKEKKLIPEELFDIEYLKDNLLKELSPVRPKGLLKKANIESIYYKAILQNLFFASLNCPIKPMEKGDNRERGFRSKKNFGQHRDANYLMRYKDQFKNPEKFLKLLNEVVPFLNGGLFECLDNKTDKIYIDGFSDNLVKPHKLIVPDYLFFGFGREVDLSGVVGIYTKAYKKAGVKGLIHILESYKFTIAENTPIEEDVALDPELLGKVFENLLASYNPETKTTARKQTGSFYTPREIVNYMVDESLIAYLKNSVKNWNTKADGLDKQLHDLLSFDNINPFAENDDLQKQIIHSLDNCKILDPACGSGAFPMGILQKMVHILQKVDPENKYWQELQLNKAVKATEGAFVITDKKEREQKLIEINDAFDEKINDPDYARKLFLIEDCIFGVDIQPIAAQISKLRFFISLIVDQKVDKDKPNFGIRALPNLETKFVTANTLIGIEKPKKQMSLFENQKVEELEKELKNVRHRIFSAKSPSTKRRLRDKDKEIREKMGDLLIENGWANETAKQLASWDPYDQNASSPFFDPEWMFDIKDGFDVVIGNPPYASAVTMARTKEIKSLYKSLYPLATGAYDIYVLFLFKTIHLLNKSGQYTWIIPNKFQIADYATKTKSYLIENGLSFSVDVSTFKVFESASVYPVVIVGDKSQTTSSFTEYLLEQYTDLEKRHYTEPLKLEKHSLIKDHNLILASGATGFEAKKIKGIISTESNKNSIPFTVSGCIDRFTISNENVRYMGLKLEKAYVNSSNVISTSKWKFWNSQKIVIAGMTKEIEAVYVNRPFGLGVGVYAVYSFGNFEPYALTGILNSSYLTFYLKNKFKDKHLAGGYLAINKSTIENLPLEKPANEKPYTVLSEILHFQGSNLNSIAKVVKIVLDSIVLEVFFPAHMKERKIDVLKFVEKDIEEVMNPSAFGISPLKGEKFVEFEKLSNTQKEKVITELHTRWSNPKSEIVKRMNSFAEKSPDILKPILESR